jgi:prepilin-type processing-associated H-X9-DG protein
VDEVAAEVEPSVVQVNAEAIQTTPFGPQEGRGLGSGVIYREDGYIITNNHVVQGAEEVNVAFADGSVEEGEVALRRGRTRGLWCCNRTPGKDLQWGAEKERRLRATVAEKKRSFWDRLFGTNNRSGRQDKVLEYVIHRIEDGANLREVLQEEYVRRNATTEEVQSILENPRLIEAAGEQLREDFSSGKLDPRQKWP